MLTDPIPRRFVLWIAAGILVLATGGATLMAAMMSGLMPWSLDPSDPRVTLEDVEREVIRRYPVADITASTLAGLLAREEVTLFDVRTEEEFDAGHLPGAIRLEPGSSADDILSRHRNTLKDRPVIFYCAVGVRSSQVMMRTLARIAPHTNGKIYTLRGGIFRWAAEGRPLNRDGGPGKPHHFDASWARLLSRTLPGS